MYWRRVRFESIQATPATKRGYSRELRKVVSRIGGWGPAWAAAACQTPSPGSAGWITGLIRGGL